MLPGPMRKGRPQTPPKLGMSVVKETIVVRKPSNGSSRRAGVYTTSRASARPASAAAAERAYIERTAAEQRVLRKRNVANVLEHIEERFDGGMAELRISGMREAAARYELITQRAFRTERQQIFRRLAVNQVARAARRFGGGDRAGTVAFFTDDEEQGKIFHAVFEKSLCSNGHGHDDAFGIAGAASPDEFFILG